MRSFLKKYRNLLIVLLVVVLGVSAFIFVRRSNADPTSQFQTAKAERGNLTATIGATGTVRAKQSAVLIWQAAGTVDTVNVKVGDNVPSDFVMAYLAKTSLPQSVIMAEADLADAQKALEEVTGSDTSLAQAAIDLKTAQEAYKKAANYLQYLQNSKKVPQSETRLFLQTKRNTWMYLYKTKTFRGPAPEDWITDAENDLALKTSQLGDAQRVFDRLNNGNTDDIAAAQARVDAARATLNLAQVVSPFAGTVTEAYPLTGDQVSAGATAFRLDNLSSLLVDVKVSEVDINNISIGQAVTLTFDAILGKEYHGKVVEVTQAGTADEGVVNFTVTVELTDADAMVKPGMTAAVNVVVQEMKDVLLIQNRAVRLVDSQRVVYVLVDGKPVQKNITLGSSSDTLSVVASGEVQEGDVVILNPPEEFWVREVDLADNRMSNVIEAHDLRKVYKMGEVEVEALRGVSFFIKRGEIISIMGPSGSGKSTLMNMLGCLDRPTSGEYVLDGEPVASLNDDQLASIRNRKVGFVFQSFNLLSRQTAITNVELPLRYSDSLDSRRDRAIEALKSVGLEDRMTHRPYELSGGQQQRVAIARAIVNNPAIIMADEPTGNLDSKVGKEIMSLLLNLNKESGTTLIIVTHDPMISEQTQRVIRLRDGLLDGAS